MRLRVALLGTLGAVATLVALLAVVAPDLTASLGPLGALVARIRAGEPRGLLVVASAVAALALAWLARGAPAEGPPGPFDELAGRPPETATAARGRRTAAALDGRIDAAVAGDDGALAVVRDRLRRAAVDAHARRTDGDRATARRAVETGRWTDDPTAAAFLADERDHGAWARLRLWLDPAAERERRVRRTVAALSAPGDER